VFLVTMAALGAECSIGRERGDEDRTVHRSKLLGGRFSCRADLIR
jgi:hypothetical protein